jgi:uncharacterized protein (TIGR02453 family)
MIYFSKDFISFFSELEKNNNREWFHENKKRYETSVKEPFENFVGGLIGKLSDVYPEMMITPKEVIFRINRDIRFSKDKSPYKTHMAALVSPGGRKDKTTPAMYVQANHLDIRVYSGSHMLEKDQLHNLRNHIATNLGTFDKLINEKKFSKTFGKILGEQNKRIPPEFQEAFEKQPLIANKSFYYFIKQEPQTILQDNLVEELVSKYKVALPLNSFITEGILG